MEIAIREQFSDLVKNYGGVTVMVYFGLVQRMSPSVSTTLTDLAVDFGLDIEDVDQAVRGMRVNGWIATVGEVSDTEQFRILLGEQKAGDSGEIDYFSKAKGLRFGIAV